MSKQDRQGARTPAQLEQEFQFGKRFAEAMGLAQDAKDEAGEAKKAIDTLDKNLDHEEIFNRLTKNGEVQGLYRENGNTYINASFIKSGILLANLLQAGVLKSKDGETFYLDLDKGILKGQFAEFSISGKTVEDIAQEKANTAESKAIAAAASDATNKANAAQSNAISTAASDATEKANAAQSNAISTASQDATEKANAAQNNAINTAATYAANKANAALTSAKSYANSAASAAVNAQTQTDIFNKLTNNGALKGIYMENGELYINASYLMSGIINASLVKAGVITSNDGSVKVDLVNNKIEVGEGTGTRPAWDSKVEVDAFGVAGYGKHYSTGEFEKTLFIRPGLHYAASSTILNAIQSLCGIGLSISTDGGTLSLGDFGAETKIYGSTVDIRSNSGSGVEYLTPPMVAGTEFRTMERFNNKPVYTKLVDFGVSSATTNNWQTKTLAHGISGISNIIKCQGCLTGSKATTLPAINGGLVMVWADTTNVHLYRETAYTPPSDERLYVQLWYTK